MRKKALLQLFYGKLPSAQWNPIQQSQQIYCKLAWYGAVNESNRNYKTFFNRLRCKKALNDTQVGVKFRKVSRSSLCQSCGNPWNMGNFKLKIRKTLKATKIKKVLTRSKTNKKLSKFDKHMLERYTECQSSLVIHCSSCLKKTVFPTPLPPKLPKQPKAAQSVKQDAAAKQETKGKKQKKSHPSRPVIHSNKQAKNQAKQLNSKKQPNKLTKPPLNKKKFSKTQLKSISNSLSDTAKGKTSTLQSFLNSVK